MAEKDQGDVIYRVEFPNIEVGVVSSREGLMSPVGREAMRIMGIHTRPKSFRHLWRRFSRGI